MKKKVVLLLLIISVSSNILSQEDNNRKFKDHFISFDFIGGFSLTNFLDYGGSIGLSFSYQHVINDYIALGPGINGIFSIMAVKYYDDYLNYKIKADFIFSGGMIFLEMIIGNFKKYDTAFMLDIGAGWIGGIYMGILIKNFSIKLGYQVTYIGIAHHITLGFGYKINFNTKKKNL